MSKSEGRVKWDMGGSSEAIFARLVYRSRRPWRAVEG